MILEWIHFRPMIKGKRSPIYPKIALEPLCPIWPRKNMCNRGKVERDPVLNPGELRFVTGSAIVLWFGDWLL